MDPNLPPTDVDDDIRTKSLATLKAKWLARQENRRKQWAVCEQRGKELQDYKKEKNLLQRKDGEVWKCGGTFKMEWTHSP